MTGQLKHRLQILHGPDIAFGPGKAALLAAIRDTGSISAAARTLDMSYRRAWLLVETCNRCFTGPLVETRPGEGAGLTPLGVRILTAYAGLSAQADALAESSDHATIVAALSLATPGDRG